MSREIIAESGEYELRKEGEWFPATLHAIEDGEGKFGPYLTWKFLIDGDEEVFENEETGAKEPKLFYFFTPARYKTNDKNALRKLMKWMTGKHYDEGQRIPVDEQVGQRFKIMFEHVTRDDKEREQILRVGQLEEPF